VDPWIGGAVEQGADGLVTAVLASENRRHNTPDVRNKWLPWRDILSHFFTRFFAQCTPQNAKNRAFLFAGEAVF